MQLGETVGEIRSAVGSRRRESDGKVVNFAFKVVKYVRFGRSWLALSFQNSLVTANKP
jgi:hypothetical protein